MLELMNLAILETNARRRVEVITDEMRASRARPATRQLATGQAGRESRRAAAVAATAQTAGAEDAPAAGSAAACASACAPASAG